MKKNTKKRLFLLLFLFAILFFYLKYWVNSDFTVNSKVNLEKGDNFQVFLNNLDYFEQLKIKTNIKLYGKEIPKISVGSYHFSGDYDVNSFLEVISQGPVQSYVKYTVLEGRSIYDIDYDLSKKGYIESGNFLEYLQKNQKKIIGQYDFLFTIDEQHKLKTLEGFLYPETYNIDESKPFIRQLLQHQLNTFEKRVWNKYGQQMQNFNKKLQKKGFSNLKFSPWAIINLASIIQKEERNINNSPTVAGIFINRLSNGIRLGADITLCYGLHMPYKQCPPSVIVQHLKDKKNKYNTRTLGGLTPTAISNPTADTIGAVLNFVKSDYFYYLHDNSGGIHYGKTLEEHNQNKNLYLR